MSWSYNKTNGQVTARLAYNYIVVSTWDKTQVWHWKDLWKWRIPLKIKCFYWLCMRNKVSTWDNLIRKGCISPNICHLCCCGGESIQHLFVDCFFGKKVCRLIPNHLGLVNSCEEIGLLDALVY